MFGYESKTQKLIEAQKQQIIDLIIKVALHSNEITKLTSALKQSEARVENLDKRVVDLRIWQNGLRRAFSDVIKDDD